MTTDDQPFDPPLPTHTPPKPRKNRCENCRFFSPDEDLHDSGECRRYAPKPHPEHEVSAWQTVLRTHWCGEFA